jgi:hypothetical protein
MKELKEEELIKLVSFYKAKSSDLELEFLKLQIISQSKLNEQEVNYVQILQNTKRELEKHNDLNKAFNDAKIKIIKLENEIKKLNNKNKISKDK